MAGEWITAIEARSTDCLLCLQSKKRRTKGEDDDEDGDSSGSEPEVKLNEDDFVGLDTSNIIPRAQRRAAAAAMTKPMEDAPTKPKATKDDDDGESSDEAEF